MKERKNIKLGGGLGEGKVYDQNILYEKHPQNSQKYIYTYICTHNCFYIFNHYLEQGNEHKLKQR